MELKESQPIHRRLSSHDYSALKAEVMRAGVELSETQLLDLADSLHSLLRLRRPCRPISDPEGWIAPEPRTLG
ncbi:MAG: hypothetical protein EON89_11560 [Brevundimonas sp.]|nr:MAG: hypothetical protein EON89_11560 [Brevundimonas sp.]